MQLADAKVRHVGSMTAGKIRSSLNIMLVEIGFGHSYAVFLDCYLLRAFHF